MSKQDAAKSNAELSPDSLVRLESNALGRLAALELIKMGVMPALKSDLQRASEEGDERLLRLIKVYVDCSALEHMQRAQEEAQWRKEAMRYLIARQAHFAMLHDLFRVTRAEVNTLRSSVQAQNPPKKPRAVPTYDLPRVFDLWGRVSKDYQREADRWVTLGQQLPEYPISSLYSTLLDVESAGRKKE